MRYRTFYLRNCGLPEDRTFYAIRSSSFIGLLARDYGAFEQTELTCAALAAARPTRRATKLDKAKERMRRKVRPDDAFVARSRRVDLTVPHPTRCRRIIGSFRTGSGGGA